MKERQGSLKAILLLIVTVGPTSCWAQGTVAVEERTGEAECTALQNVHFSTVADAPTRINRANLVTSVAELLADLPQLFADPAVAQAKKNIRAIQPYCRVSGYVTPNVGFELLLPINHWNGKLLHVGCVGWCGSTGYVGMLCAQHPDYACVGTDMGHTGAGGLWFRNNVQAQIDFSYRATHVATLAGKAITTRFYNAAPTRAYFFGCSTGGYQGLVEAQRFPWDFDGIVAGAPDMDESDLAVRAVWIKQSLVRRDGRPILSPEAIELLHRAALARCDMDDGVKDGIISDPAHCQFDPAELLCKRGGNGHCLSTVEVQAAKNIYGAPVTSKGVPLSSRGLFPGSEGNWTDFLTRTWGDEYFEETALLTLQGKQWKYTDFDFDRDYPRSGAGVTFSDTNPDLRRFKAAGGKLLIYQGGDDTLEIPGAVFDYYETVEKTMGGREATQDFIRLFAIPGMNHCSEGDGVFAFDYLGYMEAWVERGRAPDMMIGAHVKDLPEYGSFGLRIPLDVGTPVSFTRPVYPYPLYAKYRGSGDPNQAANFRPVMPTSAR